MSRCVIKKAVVAASLGLAMFVTFPANAGPDEVLLGCVSVSAGEHVIKNLVFSEPPLVKLPPDVELGGACLAASQQLLEAGYNRAASGLTTLGSDEAETVDLDEDSEPGEGAAPFDFPTDGSLPLITITWFTCKDFGSCLVP